MEIQFDATGNIVLDQALAQQIESLPLEGSEKQISWAKDIRHNAVMANIKRFNGMVNSMHMEQKEMTVAQRDAAAAGISKLANLTSAKFWIDNREANPQLLLSKYGR